ncbi:MAG: hypothetical protein R6W67_10300 [Bacteroidales bacterium]
MKLLRVMAISLGATLCLWCAAQEQRLLPVISKIVNEMAEETGEENAELLTELLFDLAAEPVLINSGDSSEISRLFFLTPFQVSTLASYIRNTGPVVSLLELASLSGFNRETAELMVPFITLDIPSVATGGTGTRLYHRAVTTASVRFRDGTAEQLVNPFRNSLRYRMRTGSLTASLTAASDAGESPLWSGRPDFITGGFAVTGSGRGSSGTGIINFIAGDYSARFGMGLVVNSGYKPFLTLTGTSFMGQRDGFRLSSSVNENNYMRGAAVTSSAGSLRLSLFFSSRYRDARLKTDTSGIVYADILSTPPVHGSLSGLAATGVLRETSSGVSLGLGKGNFRWALTACHTAFSREVREGGSGSFNAGASYRMAMGKVSGAGELAISGNGSMATAHTFNIRFDDRLTGNLIYRNYSRSYYGHLSGGPGRNTLTGNEEGLMTRIMYEAARGFFIHAGADVYRFPWLKQRLAYPSHGYRAEVKARYENRDGFATELRIYGGETWKNKPGTATATGPGTGGVPSVMAARQTTMRLTMSGNPASAFRFSIHALYKSTGENDRGSMLAGDAGFAPLRFPLSVWIRHALFTTGSFDSGLYLYENDMLYGFSIPVHHGEGSRTAIILNAEVGKNADMRIKYGIMRKYPAEGNPLQEELKMQFKFNF